MTFPQAFLFCALAACLPSLAPAQAKPEVPSRFGTGSQFVGVNAAYSPVAGEVWGYTTHTRYTTVALEYGVNLTHGRTTRLRYVPELVPFATLYEGTPSQTNPAAPVRDFASGARPVGLELGLLRGRKVQPYFNTHEGFLYYNRRVLSPGGSQFMFTLDFGAGARVFATAHNAISFSYRYQHQSNANISLHNPGTDGHTLTVGLVHFTRR